MKYIRKVNEMFIMNYFDILKNSSFDFMKFQFLEISFSEIWSFEKFSASKSFHVKNFEILLLAALTVQVVLTSLICLVGTLTFGEKYFFTWFELLRFWPITYPSKSALTVIVQNYLYPLLKLSRFFQVHQLYYETSQNV